MFFPSFSHPLLPCLQYVERPVLIQAPEIAHLIAGQTGSSVLPAREKKLKQGLHCYLKICYQLILALI